MFLKIIIVMNSLFISYNFGSEIKESSDGLPKMNSIEKSRLKDATVSISKLVEDTIANRVKQAKNEITNILLKSIDFYVKDAGSLYFNNITCNDELKDCPSLKKEGLCLSSKKLMLNKCKKTCDFCNTDENSLIDLMNVPHDHTNNITVNSDETLPTTNANNISLVNLKFNQTKPNDNKHISHTKYSESKVKKFKKPHLRKTKVKKHIIKAKKKHINKSSLLENKKSLYKHKKHFYQSNLKRLTSKHSNKKPMINHNHHKKPLKIIHRDKSHSIVNDEKLKSKSHSSKYPLKIKDVFEKTSKLLIEQHKEDFLNKKSPFNPLKNNKTDSESQQKVISFGKVELIPSKNDITQIIKIPETTTHSPTNLDFINSFNKVVDNKFSKQILYSSDCPYNCLNECLATCPKECCILNPPFSPSQYEIYENLPINIDNQPLDTTFMNSRCSTKCIESNCNEIGCSSFCCSSRQISPFFMDEIRSKEIFNMNPSSNICPSICQQNCLPSLCIPSCCSTSQNTFKYSNIPEVSVNYSLPIQEKHQTEYQVKHIDNLDDSSLLITPINQSLFCQENCQNTCDEKCIKNNCCLD